MAKHKVKCPSCEQYFYREDEECVKVNNRYYHKRCYDETTKDDIIIDSIHCKMRELCGNAYNKKRIDAKISAYKKMGFTPIGIKRSLDYWYDIKKNDPTAAYGSIGIVEYVYNEAIDYWMQKEESKKQYNGTNFNKWKESLEPKVVHTNPTVTTRPKRLKLFHLE